MSVLLTDEQEERLLRRAAKSGKSVSAVLDELLEVPIQGAPSARELLKMSKAERDAVLRNQAANAVTLYDEDLSLPIESRELTAFTYLDGEHFSDMVNSENG